MQTKQMNESPISFQEIQARVSTSDQAYAGYLKEVIDTAEIVTARVGLTPNNLEFTIDGQGAISPFGESFYSQTTV